MFIDFKAAFDTVNKEEFIILTKLTESIKMTLKNTTCVGWINGKLSQDFDVNIQLWVSDLLSTVLFNIVFEEGNKK